ncbi:MAG: protein kinase, partial [Phycisphaeraceae bacterium]|nr:protein kinase [Phycisphaeraceae bacterium]
VKIADFGLAKLLGQERSNFTLTEAHHVMGTPHYMAPEQVEHPKDVDHRADIYSLGVVFYEMLTGELPLGKFAPPSGKVEVDVRLDDVVLRTLEKEPQRRYQNVSEVRTQVQTIVSTPGQQAATLPAANMGFEYRSKRTLWGLPLVHITRGTDPVTGRPRTARGIIAIGDQARGVVAFGGVAVGVVSFGGLSVGLLSFGGCALGLLAAVGGLAVALGCAVGGGAVGFIALGGGAIGYLAYGGGAWGVHAFGGNASDPVATQFFEPWAKGLLERSLAWQWPILAIILGVGIGVPAWIEAQKRPARDVRRRSLKWGFLAWVVMIAALVTLNPRLVQRHVATRGGTRTTTLFEIHQGSGVVAEDLDAGEGRYRPSNWPDMSESQRARWAQSEGVDLMLDDIGEPWNLVTPTVQGITAVRVDNRLWNRMSVRDLTRALSESKTQMTVRQDDQWRRYALTDDGLRRSGLNCPITLVIRTAKDNTVLVQITSCVLEPRAITFNWKFLKPPSDLAALLQRQGDLDMAPNPAEIHALSMRIQAAIADVNMVSYPWDVSTARTQIESVLALEAQLMAAMADTETESLWRTVMDQARELRHAIRRGQGDQFTRVMVSLKATLDQAIPPGSQ